MKPQFVIATYQVALQHQEDFFSLLNETETIMRREDLITSKPIFRMKSIQDPKVIMEVFEWKDDSSFDKAQHTPSVLSMWGKYESLWEKGGFGINQVPESNQPWAQFTSV